MDKSTNILLVYLDEIAAAWEVLSKRGAVPLPNASLAETFDQAMENCPTCKARRSAKAASMRRFRLGQKKKARKRK